MGREDEFSDGYAQSVVPGAFRMEIVHDRCNVRLELRRQVQTEDVDFGNHCFISINAMRLDAITQSIHGVRRGRQKGEGNKKQSLVGMCCFQPCSFHSLSGALSSFIL